jgi:uncharacterized RDD family membrane protein YckC
MVYYIKRGLSAIFDFLIFAILMKLMETFIGNIDDKGYYYSIEVSILFYYIIYLFQDFCFGRTLGKYLFNFKIVFDDNNISYSKKMMKLALRRVFDLFEIIFPFLYIGFIFLTKKQNKLGDIITKTRVVSTKN